MTSQSQSLENFYDLSRDQLGIICQEFLAPAVHAETIYRNAYKRRVGIPWQHDTLPRRLSAGLDGLLSLQLPEIGQVHESQYDGSVKFMFRLHDGLVIESVLMPEKSRLTICLSSQAGCAQGCVFCHTGRMGLQRNLTAGEIVGQLQQAGRWMAAHPQWLSKWRLPAGQAVTNIVFMGMGEPLDNVDAVARSIGIFSDPLGSNIALRKISVSTAGHLDGLKEITRLVPDVRLAFSLHQADHVKRVRLMPISRQWPAEEIMGFMRERSKTHPFPLLVQYTVIHGVNDTDEDAGKVIELLAGTPVKVNLIPLNPIDPSRLQAPGAERLQGFRDTLQAAGLRVMIRYSKGQDIAAACGQLAAVNS